MKFSRQELTEKLKSSADQMLVYQQLDGSFPAGENGPHAVPETPVRVTAHWVVVFCTLFDIYKSESYRNAIYRAAEYLKSSEARPHGFAFHCLLTKKRDQANGVIGQAWVLEALLSIYKLFPDVITHDLLASAAKAQPFCGSVGLWEVIDINGVTYKTRFDLAVNHQLWFAAIVSEILDHISDDALALRLQSFILNFDKNIRIKACGRFAHVNAPRLKFLWLKPTTALKTLNFIQRIAGGFKRNDPLFNSGYHLYHLYPILILMRSTRCASLLESQKVRVALDFALSGEFYDEVWASKYGLHYNPPGIEFLVVMHCASMCGLLAVDADLDTLVAHWLRKQFDLTWSSDRCLMDNVKYDPVTYSARIYESCRFLRLSSAPDFGKPLCITS